MRVCTKCYNKKFLSQFYKDKQKKGGLSSRCKICINKTSKEYQETHKQINYKYYGLKELKFVCGDYRKDTAAISFGQKRVKILSAM